MTKTVEPSPAVPAISRGQLRSARTLLTRKGRFSSGQFLAEGAQAVREALGRPGAVQLLIVDDVDAHADLLAAAAGLPVVLAGRKDLAQITDTVTPQGIVAICRMQPAVLSDVSAARLVVICAQVRDPGNAGTVIRCADAFGADAVVMTRGSVDVHNPKTVRASVGTLFHLPVIEEIGLIEAVEWAHRLGLQVLAADGGGDSLQQLDAAGDLAKPTAWLMGNEAWGLPAEQKALADQVVGVPMWGSAESLNLSTAAAVCLYTTASAQRQ